VQYEVLVFSSGSGNAPNAQLPFIQAGLVLSQAVLPGIEVLMTLASMRALFLQAPLETAHKSGQVLTEKVIARASLVCLPD